MTKITLLPQVPQFYLSHYACPKCPSCGKRFYEAIYERLHNFKYKIEGKGWVQYTNNLPKRCRNGL